MENKICFVVDEEGVYFDDSIVSDKDVLCEIIISEIKMNNWWVVLELLERKIRVDNVIDELRLYVKNELCDIELGNNYVIGFESNFILSSEYSIGMVEKGSECYNNLVRLEEDVDCDLMYGDLYKDLNIIDDDKIGGMIVDICKKVDDEKVLRKILDKI